MGRQRFFGFRFYRKIIQCVLFSWFLVSTSHGYTSLTINEFATHIQLHVLRVQQLGLELKRLYPSEFRDVDSKTISDFLQLHDKAKLEPQTLKELFSFFGRPLESMSTEEKVTFNALKNKLNNHDSKIGIDFLKRKGLISSFGKITVVGRKLLLIQKITDVVDRGLDPISAIEFGKTLATGSGFIHSPKAKMMAQALETRYTAVVRGLQFGKISTKVASSIFKTFAVGISKIVAAPVGILLDVLTPEESIAGDEEEFKIFYRKHPEIRPHYSSQ